MWEKCIQRKKKGKKVTEHVMLQIKKKSLFFFFNILKATDFPNTVNHNNTITNTFFYI